LRLLGEYLKVVKYLNHRTGEEEEEQGSVVSEVQMTAVRESSVHLAPVCNGFIRAIADADRELPGVEVLGPGIEMVVNYLVASTPTPTNGEMREEDVKSGLFLPAVDGLEEGLRRLINDGVVERSLEVVYGGDDRDDSFFQHEELLVSVIRGVCALRGEEDLASKVRTLLLSKLRSSITSSSTLPAEATYHALILFLTTENFPSDFTRNLAYNLLSTITPGHENIADFIMENFLPSPLSGFLRGELRGNKRRVAQLAHSMSLNGTGVRTGSGPFGMTCLRKTVGIKEMEEDSTLLLPMGDRWLVHALSSAGMGYETAKTMTASVATIVLDLLMEIEAKEDFEGFRVRMGVNECVYHALVVAGTGLGEVKEVGEKVVKLLELYSTKLSPRKVVAACHVHKSPLSAPQKNLTTSNPGDKIYDPEASIAHAGGYTSTELRSWKEFVLDFCNRFTGECPGPGATSYALRMILRPVFPSEVTEEAFEKLRGYLKVVGAEATKGELVETVLDEKKLPTDLLDSYVNILRGDFKVNDGYFFRLAVISLLQDHVRTRSTASVRRIRKIECQREKVERMVAELGGRGDVPRAEDLLELMERLEM
jgi:hypothetical protein